MLTHLESAAFCFRRDEGLHIVTFTDLGPGYKAGSFVRHIYQVRVNGPGYAALNETTLRPSVTSAQYWLRSVLLEKRLITYKRKDNE